jgi:hypothetical protein
MTTPPGQGRAATLRATAGTSVLDPVRLGVPDNPIPLPPGHLACAQCGIAVLQNGQAPVVAEAFSRADQPPRAPRPTTSPLWSLHTEFLQCPACLARDEVADALLDAHPRVRARLGSAARHQVTCALAGLAVLNHDLAASALPEPVVMSLLRHLSAPGSMVRWMARFAPVLLSTATPGTCGPWPWSHVRGLARLHLREGYAAVLADRVASGAPPVALRPPEPEAGSAALRLSGACLLCGVGSVRLPAATVLALGGRRSAAHSVWLPLTTTPASLGGPGSAERIAGFACPSCFDAVDIEGAVGPSALERAFIEHLRSTGREDDAMKLVSVDVDGLAGWGVLAYVARRRGEPTLAANRVAWGHIRLTDCLRETQTE